MPVKRNRASMSLSASAPRTRLQEVKVEASNEEKVPVPDQPTVEESLKAARHSYGDFVSNLYTQDITNEDEQAAQFAGWKTERYGSGQQAVISAESTEVDRIRALHKAFDDHYFMPLMAQAYLKCRENTVVSDDPCYRPYMEWFKLYLTMQHCITQNQTNGRVQDTNPYAYRNLFRDLSDVARNRT